MNPPADLASLVGVSQKPAPNDVLRKWWGHNRREVSISLDQALAEASNTDVLDVSKFVLDESIRSDIQRQCPNLKWLRLHGDPVDKETLDWVAGFVELRGLSLKNSMLGENDLYFLKDLRNLEWLDLRVGRLPSAEHLRIGPLPRLEVLFLDVPGFTDDHLNNLQGLPNLKVLSLGHTSISDEGVAAIANEFPDLRFLRLYLVKELTEKSMFSIASLKELKYLHVGLTPLERQLYDRDSDGLPALQKLLPKCFIGIGD